MICKNCSAEYDDSYSFCPKCGKENTEKFTVEIPEYTEYPEYTEHAVPRVYTDISSFSDNSSYEERPEAEENLMVSENDGGYAEHQGGYADNYDVEEDGQELYPLQQDTDYEEQPVQETDNEQEEPDLQPVCPEYSPENGEESSVTEAESVETADNAEVAPKKKRPLRRVPSVNRKEETGTVAVIIAVMCVVAVLAASLSVLKIGTDSLETTEPVEKVVATVGFSAQEEIMLEEVLARCFAALRTDFNSELSDAESFLARVNLYDKGGVYSRVYSEYPQLKTEADPLDRFFDGEEEQYAYYKVEEKKIDELLSIFDLDAYHEVNTAKCYYFDGFYYFAPVVQKITPAVNAEITKSKRVLDGSYYSECYFYAESGEKRVQTDTYYLVTEKVGDINNGTVSFKVKKISKTPVFDESGKLAEARTHKIKKQVIEGKTESGKVYCRYTFEYPVFTEDNAGYQSINSFFADAINAYRLRADSARKDYESFIKQGGKDSELPFTETVIARVSYENEKYISIVEKNAITAPKAEQSVPATEVSEEESEGTSDEETQDAPEEEVTLFERTVDGYVFDKATGGFVSKDVLIGKDYMAVSEILFRIYNSYEYESIIPEAKTEDVTDEYGETVEDEEEYYDDEEEEYYYSDDEVPDDEDGFGTKIYESACAFTEKGLTFYYVNEDGVVEEVTIPHAVVERLAQS